MNSWLCGTFFAQFSYCSRCIKTSPPVSVRLRVSQISYFIIVLGSGGFSMTRTIYTLICGALILLAAVTPVVILVLDKAIL